MQLSVIIATFNRAQCLDQTLDHCACLESGGISWELLIVDNCSTDNTREVVERYASRLPLQYQFTPVPGKNHALNHAVPSASGEIIVFADDDITPESGWLREILASTARWKECCVFGGRVVPVYPPGMPAHLQSSDFSGYVYGIHELPQSEGYYPDDGSPGGANCWFRRRVFDDGWRFDPTIGPKGRVECISGSELEFYSRLKGAGFDFVYVPSASISHRIQQYQKTMKYLLKRSFASGRGHTRIEGYPAGAKKLLGAPRYLYRQLFEAIASATGNGLVLRRKRAFERLMHAAKFVGCIHQARFQRHNPVSHVASAFHTTKMPVSAQ